MSRYSEFNTELVDINRLRTGKTLRKFTKMHGCGNDYIYFDCMESPIDSPERLSIALCDRHKGIGGDGVILICPSKVAEARMRMFNLDGSEGKMCGNGIRCVAKYLFDNNIVRKHGFDIETGAGVRGVMIHTQNGEATSVTVDMGKASLAAKDVPVVTKKAKLVAEKVKVGGEEREITCVSMGNPHCVIFVKHLDSLDVNGIGEAVEVDPMFPERTNVEFVKVMDSHTLRMRVWERGSGETLACGTGACAAAVAAVEAGLCPKGEDITVRVPGGDLVVKYTDEAVYLTGEAVKIFDGEIEI